MPTFLVQSDYGSDSGAEEFDDLDVAKIQAKSLVETGGYSSVYVSELISVFKKVATYTTEEIKYK